MKKIFLIGGALMMISSFVNAGVIDNPKETSASSVELKGDVVNLHYTSSQKAPVKVVIYNEKNEKILSEILKAKKQSFVRPYNFSQMPEGNYTIVLEDANGTKTETISIERSSPALHAAIIDMKEDTRRCAVTLSGVNNAYAVITVKNLRNQQVFSKELMVNGTETVLLNLEDVDGDATVEVYGSGEYQSKVIR